MHTDTLRAAYEAAVYEVECEDGPAAVRIGAPPPPAVDAALARHDAARAAFLTAANPRSQPLDAAENAHRHDALLRELAALGVPCLAGRGRDPSGDWPAEPSVLAIGVDRARALALAERFGQNAYVEIRVRRPARLAFTALWPESAAPRSATNGDEDVAAPPRERGTLP